MNRRSKTKTDRAERLIAWYPRAWRSRYGEEFTELLIADISERPRSWRRSADVVRGGLVARLTSLGLCGCTPEATEQVRASLVSLGCSLAIFLAFGVTMWSQLTIGWQWSEPDTATTAAATILMSLAILLFLSLALLAAVPIAWTVLSRIVSRRSRNLFGPSTLFILGGALLFIGGRHFGNGWPGTGGHPWAHQGLVPGGLAAFSWASTLSVSSYWAHFSALLKFPRAEVAWMVLSPLAIVCLVAGAAKTVRRLDLSRSVLVFETRLATAALFAMIVFLGASCCWVVDGGPGPRNLFHAGAIDVVGVFVMTGALAVAQRAVLYARRGGLDLLSL